MEVHEARIDESDRDQPFDSRPALARGSLSGFRPTGVLESATGLPVGLHQFCRRHAFRLYATPPRGGVMLMASYVISPGKGV